MDSCGGSYNRDNTSREKLIQIVEDSIGHKVLDEKISKIGIYTRNHSYKSATIEVGESLDKNLAGCEDEKVIDIFKTEAEFYVVLTPNHGLEKGRPYIFRDQDIYKVEEEE